MIGQYAKVTWHDVATQKPSELDGVLVMHVNSKLSAFYDPDVDRFFCSISGQYLPAVKHWMLLDDIPVPTPPSD